MNFRKGSKGTLFVPARGTPPPPPVGYVQDPKNKFRYLLQIVPDGASEQEVYQHLYNDPTLKYGDANFKRCPGVRFLPLYKHWLEGKVFDFGCGRGHTVLAIRRLGFKASGIDQIDLDNEFMVGDITKPVDTDFDTATCIDVFEHLLDPDLLGLIKNMQRAKKQVISVHTGPAFENGVKRDLHINKKSFAAWEEFLKNHFDVASFERTGRQRGLFFCHQK